MKNHSQKRRVRGVLSGFMATTMTASLLPVSTTNAYYYSDVAWWATTAVDRWSNAGVIKGYGSDWFGAGDYITRGDLALILCNIMGYEVQSEASVFFDIGYAAYWVQDPVLKLHAATLMMGDGYFSEAGDDITREEVCLILGRAFNIEGSSDYFSSFNDSSSIASWALPYVIALKELGAVSGRGDNLFEPKAQITRQEMMVMINKLAPNYYSDKYQDSTLTSGTAVINMNDFHSDDWGLSGNTITEDLVIAEGVADGDVTIDDVKVSNNVIVKGGGDSTVYLSDVTVGNKLLISRQKDEVRVAVAGNSSISNVEIKNTATLDATGVSSGGKVDHVVVKAENYLFDETGVLADEMFVTLSGTFASLSNETEGVEYFISGYIEEIKATKACIINGVTVEEGETFDSSSLPGYDMTAPTITLTADYGSADEDSSLDPEAVLTSEVTYFNPVTGEVEVKIEVESMEDCKLMNNPANAVSVYNPNNSTSLSALELEVVYDEESSYDIYTVTFFMEQNFSEIPLQVNFKAEDEEPTVKISKNFNNISNASATVEELNNDDYETSTSNSGITTAYIAASYVRNCEPHYNDEYIFSLNTADVDEETYSVKLVDDDDDVFVYEVQFDSTKLDDIDLTMNFLTVGAEDLEPKVRASMTYKDSELIKYLDMDNYGLNEYGQMYIDIVVAYSDLSKKYTIDDVDEDMSFQLKSTASRAISIDANSGETEYGYGLSYDVSLSHMGNESYYTITFDPAEELDQVYFQVEVDPADTLSVMDSEINISRLPNDGTYFKINRNTATINSSGKMTVQVYIDLEALEKLTGYELDTRTPVSVYDNGGDYDVDGENIGNTQRTTSISKIEEGLYEISFSPLTNTITDLDTDTTSISYRPVKIELNLEQTEDYVALYASEGVSSTNLPYTVLASEHDSFDYKISFKVKAGNWWTTDAADYKFTDFVNGDCPDIQLVAPEDELFDEVLEKLQVSVGGNNEGYRTVVIYFDTAARVNPEDIAFYFRNVDTSEDVSTAYEHPTISDSDISLATGEGEITYLNHTSSTSTAQTGSVTFKVTLKNNYEVADVILGNGCSNITAISRTIDPQDDGSYLVTVEYELNKPATDSTLKLEVECDVIDPPEIVTNADSRIAITVGTVALKSVSGGNLTYTVPVTLNSNYTLDTANGVNGLYVTGDDTNQITNISFTKPTTSSVYTFEFTIPKSYSKDVVIGVNYKK